MGLTFYCKTMAGLSIFQWGWASVVKLLREETGLVKSFVGSGRGEWKEFVELFADLDMFSSGVGRISQNFFRS